MAWTVLYHDAFLPEMAALEEEVQDSLLLMAELLIELGLRSGGPMPTRWQARAMPT